MAILMWGFFGIVAATIASLFLHFYAKRNVSVEVPGRRRVIFSCTVAPFLALLWLLVTLLIHVGISNQLAHQDCGFSPDPYVTLPNGYVVGSANTYDGYFHAPGVETDVPVIGPGYMRSLIDLKFSPPYFRGTQFDFKTSKIRSFVFDTKTREVQVSEQRSQGDRVCETSDKTCLDAWMNANNHAQLDTDSYWAIYAKYRHHWPNYILIALIFLGEGALALGVWKIWKRAMSGPVICPN